MTNAEKYKEVFGLDPDTNTCPTMNCSDCPYRKDNDDVFPECFNSSSFTSLENDILLPSLSILTDVSMLNFKSEFFSV